MLKITSITTINPAPCKHFRLTMDTPDGVETFEIHDSRLEQLLAEIRQAVPAGVSNHAIVAIIWAAWKNKVRGATPAQILNKDIDI